MMSRPLRFIACLLGLLVLPGVSGLAQNTRDGRKTGKYGAIVWIQESAIALIPTTNAHIRLTFSDGHSLYQAPSGQEITLFTDLPVDGEYLAEISADGYSTAIYHGRIPTKPGSRLEFNLAKDPAGSAKEQSPFKDPGVADVEGFVVCPAESWHWVSEPLPDAFVLYTSSVDSVYTTTDLHGYFRFEGIKDKKGKVSVSHMTCRSVEAAVPPEDGSRWLWLRTEQDPLKLAAAKITDSMPVISIVGDTVRYNVAATQKLMHGDRLGDVLERLPGMTVENGAILVLGKPLSEILVNNSDLFGRNQQDALNYLAALQINKIDVYEKEDERNPQSGRRRVVMNVKTKRALKNITDIDVSVAGGMNMPLSSEKLLPPERWQAGLGGRYFSVPTIVTLDLGANNLGIDSGRDLSRLSDTQAGNSALIKPVFASVRAQKALELNKDKTYALQTLAFNYSFKKREQSTEKETGRSYDPDDDWISREYQSRQMSVQNDLTHRGEFRWNSEKSKIWRPHASLAYSHNEAGRKSDFWSHDEIRSAGSGNNVISLHQLSELNTRNYQMEGDFGTSASLNPKLFVVFNLSFKGGEGDGSEIRSDSTSTQKTWITSDDGKNAHLSADAGITKRMDHKSISFKYAFHYDHGLQRKLRYDEVMDDGHLSTLTSEDSRSNIYQHTLSTSYDSETIGITAGLHVARVLDARELPYREDVDKVFPAPVFRVNWKLRHSFTDRFTLGISTQSNVPTLTQLGSVFHDSNPHDVSRGNPNLKQAHTLSLSANGTNLISGGSLVYSSYFSYRINEVVATRTYYAQETILDGYTLPAASTFNTFANSTGGMSWNSNISYSTTIKAIRYKMDFSAGYVLSKKPSFVNERFEHYISHRPTLRMEAKSNFSSRYKLDFFLYGGMNLTDSPHYGASRYSDLSASVYSDNRITNWLFVRAGYRHSTRIPMSERITRRDTDMLNASTGVFLMDSRLCVALIFRDILNNAPPVTTSAYSNYLETVRTTNMNRYILLSIRYVFNSSER